jgi:multidrug efflux pump subunit AcrA (membrane-fusion protein)
VAFGVSPALALALREGARATWTDPSGREQSGSLERVIGEVNPATGLMDAIVVSDPGNPDTPPGLIVRGEIEVRRQKDAVLVPSAAVVRAADEQVGAVVTEGKVAIARVQVVGRHGDVAAIDGPVKPGDRVVVEGGYNLPDGARVVEDERESSRPPESRPETNGK